ncbi:uncharacterized protein KY384_001968 [Bacidia gigantensis]|uniref:uncharacterized protein n=1 Tax=Bacidia gigantensis TaxID=2732470 RepID=UPI001D047DE0|nr:uncharacterized protein KY384_001968 [Bacidia gigantensis]KAG8533185.1 hypothetical protein KY384_001968 [Bacidia gigantensis]
MAAQAGEERLMIVFADIHYFFGLPTPKPSSHRFEKGSYLYLYGNRSGSGARLEVANNAGTQYQDAFTGNFDTATVRQSHKHPTLCTVTIDGYHRRGSNAGTPTPRAQHHWMLPDPHAQGHRLLPLHTVDVYFWTSQDADSFVNNVKKLLQHDQVVLLDVPTPQPAQEKAMSPVVQQLEKAAIQDPSYQARNNNSPSQTPSSQATGGSSKPADPAAYQPLAYNPAAPAAPEPIKHREKTPPPADADTGTGLAAAAYADQTQMASQSSLSRPPYGQSSYSHGYVGSPPQAPSSSHIPTATGQRLGSVASIPPPPPQSPPNQASPSNQQLVPTFSPPPQTADAPQYDESGKPLQSPATQVLGNSYVGGAHQPLQHVQPQYADYLGSTGHQSPAPPGGYSNFTYTPQPPQAPERQGTGYDVHSQVYRPTEDEAKRDKKHTGPQAGPGQQAGKLEQQAGRVDKGVNRLIKGIGKRMG